MYLKKPVVSFLAPSASASNAAQTFLYNLFPSVEPISLSNDVSDELDKALRVPGSSKKWTSTASKCSSSGTILHLLSLVSTREGLTNKDSGPLSLFGISDSQSKKRSDADSIYESRDLIASHVKEQNGQLLRSFRLMMNHFGGRSIQVSEILGFGVGLPLVSFTAHTDGSPLRPTKQRVSSSRLKEIGIPYYDDSEYPGGKTLLSMLGSSALHRPTVGLYQLSHDGTAIRPLPSAKEDHVLPAPSLVFYCEDLDEVVGKLPVLGAVSAKIGFNGLQKSGQVMLSHPSLPGLDIRLTDCPEYTSAFPEAQEALLASSFGELQNVNVLLEGGKESMSTRAQIDNRINEGDCWVEFRASIKRPSGFYKRATKSRAKEVRIAKAPDLPYE